MCQISDTGNNTLWIDNLYSEQNDRDGDGLLNGDELTHGTNPFLPDTDSDNLNDCFEANYGTDPHVADTDGDGYSDGIEVAMRTNPMDPSSYPTTAPTPQPKDYTLWIILSGVIIAAAILAIGVLNVFFSPKKASPETGNIGSKIKLKGVSVEDPVAILKVRLAKGEIKEDEFLRKKKLLGS